MWTKFCICKNHIFGVAALTLCNPSLKSARRRRLFSPYFLLKRHKVKKIQTFLLLLMLYENEILTKLNESLNIDTKGAKMTSMTQSLISIGLLFLHHFCKLAKNYMIPWATKRFFDIKLKATFRHNQKTAHSDFTFATCSRKCNYDWCKAFWPAFWVQYGFFDVVNVIIREHTFISFHIYCLIYSGEKKFKDSVICYHFF